MNNQIFISITPVQVDKTTNNQTIENELCQTVTLILIREIINRVAIFI